MDEEDVSKSSKMRIKLRADFGMFEPLNGYPVVEREITIRHSRRGGRDVRGDAVPTLPESHNCIKGTHDNWSSDDMYRPQILPASHNYISGTHDNWSSDDMYRPSSSPGPRGV